MIKRILLAALCLASTFALASEEPNLETVKSAVEKIQAKVLADAKADDAKTGKTTSRTELGARIAAQVKTLLAGVDVNSIPPKDASDWSRYFSMAEMNEAAKQLDLTAFNSLSVDMMVTAGSLIPQLLQDGEYEKALYLIKHVPDYDASMVGMVGESVWYGLKRTGLDKKRPEFALQCLRTLRNRIDLAPSPMSGRANGMADYCYVDLSMKMLEMRYSTKPDPAILREAKALRARFANSKSTNAFGQGPAHRVDEFLERATAIGTVAPQLVADRSLGDFKSLDALKGKVVVLDFMAHWCGPCKAALPGLRKMQSELGPQGLQIVSVTSFYGYYGSEQGLKPDVEFDRMKEFEKSYQMDWPVVFDAKQVSHARYHVSMIPHLVVIDQKGLVRRVQVGNTPEGEAETVQTIRKLLAEKGS